jgi:hypothetical protein
VKAIGRNADAVSLMQTSSSTADRRSGVAADNLPC